MASQKSMSKVFGSEALRRKGNEMYRQVANGSYGPCILRYKLSRAHRLYEEALDTAEPSDSNEKSSCYKNLGSVNWLWGKEEWNIYMKEEGGNEALTAICAAKQHISKAVEFHILALEFGELGNKPSIWLKQEEDTLTAIIEWVKEQLSKYNICFEPILVELCIAMENAGSTSSQRKKQLATSVIKREGEKSAESFLVFIYKEHNHPDPRKRVMGNIGTKENVKGALRKAIVAYHPDHNGQYERDWQVLCEEISKILNYKYDNFKSQP